MLKRYIIEVSKAFIFKRERTSFEHFQAFVDKIHAGCSKMENFHDNLSLVEQEICFRGQTFYASVGSSWSLNIMLERIAAGKMGNIHNTNLLQEIKVHNRSSL